jgi:hypothetical protein
MRVKIGKKRNVKVRSSPYDVYKVNGKMYCINLGVEMRGDIPASLRGFRNIIFERNRMRAQEKLEAIEREARRAKISQYILEKISEQKTGSTVPEVAFMGNSRTVVEYTHGNCATVNQTFNGVSCYEALFSAELR